MSNQDSETLLFTSALPDEWKLAIFANAAVVFAHEEKHVLIIDTDMRKPTVLYTFHLTGTLGLSILLTRQATLAVVVKVCNIDNLHVIRCGPIPPKPIGLIGRKMMAEMKGYNEINVFNTPPVLSVTDGQILLNKCTLLVMGACETEKEGIVKAKDTSVTSQTNFIGTV